MIWGFVIFTRVKAHDAFHKEARAKPSSYMKIPSLATTTDHLSGTTIHLYFGRHNPLSDFPTCAPT
jgi:hypothetical protein